MQVIYNNWTIVDHNVTLDNGLRSGPALSVTSVFNGTSWNWILAYDAKYHVILSITNHSEMAIRIITSYRRMVPPLQECVLLEVAMALALQGDSLIIHFGLPFGPRIQVTQPLEKLTI